MEKTKYYKKYKDIPWKIQKMMRDLGVKFTELKEVKKVYWGGIVFVFKECIGWTFKTEDLVKNNVTHIESIGMGASIVITPKMEEHDIVETLANITDERVIIGTHGTIVSVVDNKNLWIEFLDEIVVPVKKSDLRLVL